MFAGLKKPNLKVCPEDTIVSLYWTGLPIVIVSMAVPTVKQQASTRTKDSLIETGDSLFLFLVSADIRVRPEEGTAVLEELC